MAPTPPADAGTLDAVRQQALELAAWSEPSAPPAWALTGAIFRAIGEVPLLQGVSATWSGCPSTRWRRSVAWTAAASRASTCPPRTSCYNVSMSVNVSVRLDDSLAARLRLRARAAGETLSDRLRRYAEEGARRDEHPLITFRDGPTGRRAGLIGGPDVWEVALWIEDLGAEGDPIATLIGESALTRAQIDAALQYRAAYSDEVAARIELHRLETAAADAR